MKFYSRLNWITRIKRSRTDEEVADLFTNLIGLGVIVFVIAIFLLAAGLDTGY